MMMMASAMFVSLVMALPAPQDAAEVDSARALVESGDLDGAMQILTVLVVQGGADALAAGVLMSEVQLASGNPEEALATLNALGEPNNASVALALGRTHLGRADALHAAGASSDEVTAALLKAQEHVKQSVIRSPAGDQAALLELGYIRLRRFGDHEEALRLAREGLEKNPDEGNLHLLKGLSNVWVYWNSKSAGDEVVTKAAYNETVDAYLKAVELLPPDQTEALAQLAWIYGDGGEAGKSVDAAIAIAERQDDPQFDLLYNLAKQYSLSREFEASSRALEVIVGISARDITQRLKKEEDIDSMATELAWSVGPFVQRGDQATARAILKAILAADPKSPAVWHNYAIMCEDTNRYEEALTAYEKSVELDPENARFYNDLGSLLHRALNRDLDRAREMYELCIAKADEQLVAVNLRPERRTALTQARSYAQNSLEELTPTTPASGGGLLEGLLEGLGELTIPELPEEEEEEQGDSEG
ncbi:MAG: tetratricopeptide repeat protein [Planctomycetota bacterium]|jgi:tetratricopeptide (TPR) repeat protein|nr:tetratricopeptide repeat protein [Planctomycetota bacterium]